MSRFQNREINDVNAPTEAEGTQTLSARLIRNKSLGVHKGLAKRSVKSQLATSVPLKTRRQGGQI